ncbi:MAG: pyridoxal phosphate-dependent aminotransferase [Thermomicrobiales bacterium]|nr:pyridoxal phosphate-dependent aminotransferase [Thermomicrobiales bacterium]
MRYRRMIMEVESPEQIGYEQVRYNLAESSMADRRLGDLGVHLDDLLLSYGDHRGEPGLREFVARDGGVEPDHVLVSVGAAGALFTVATALLNAGDRLVVAHPNYASNLETPRAIGAEIVSLLLTLDGGFRVDLDHLRSLITPGTKLVSLTTPHNPTGAVIPPADLREIIRMVEQAGAWLLLDETYRELSDAPPLPAVTLSERVLSVSSLSKTYGAPGIRIGWVLCRDARLMETLLAAKEQIALAHSVVDEAIARTILERREALLPGVVQTMRQHRQLVAAWMASEPWLEWVEPQGGVVCFPRIVADSGVDPARFYQTLNERYATWVGPGHWFEQDPRHFRLGFGYPTTPDLRQALHNVSAALSEATTG